MKLCPQYTTRLDLTIEQREALESASNLCAVWLEILPTPMTEADRAEYETFLANK